MKRFLKIFLITLFVIVLISVIVGIQSLSQFAREVRAHQRETIAQVAPGSAVLANVNAAQEEEQSSAMQTDPQASGARLEKRISRSQSRLPLKDVLEYLDSQPLLRTCQWMAKAATMDKEKQLKWLESAKAVSMAQAIVSPMLYQFRLPRSRELLMLADEDPTLFNDVRFAAQIYSVKVELESHIEEAEAVQTRAYYHWVFSQIIFKNPSIVGDASVAQICFDLGDLENAWEKDNLNETISTLMERAQVKSDEIDFDPEYTPKVEVKWGPQGFYFKGNTDFIRK